MHHNYPEERVAMNRRFYTLSIAFLMLAFLPACWRKKCCKPAPEKEPMPVVIKEHIEIDKETQYLCGEDLGADEFPLDEELQVTQERVSGPRGWPKSSLK